MNAVFVSGNGQELAAKAVDLFYRRHPAAVARYPVGAREKCADDMRMHLLYVAGADAVDSLDLLVDYLAWVRGLFVNLGLPTDDLRPSLECLAEGIEASGGQRDGLLRRGLEELDRLPLEFTGSACAIGPLAGPAERYLSALLAADSRTAENLVIGAVDGGISIASVFVDMIAPAMREVGRLWYSRRIGVAEEHYVSAATQEILARLYPRVFAAGCRGPVLVATCVEGELHELGMRMVADLFQLRGWDARFLGANTPPKAVVAFADQVGAAVVAISAMTAATVPAVAKQVALLRASPGGDRRKILVGGHPFTVDRDLWRRVGADATAADGRDAMAVADGLMAGAA